AAVDAGGAGAPAAPGRDPAEGDRAPAAGHAIRAAGAGAAAGARGADHATDRNGDQRDPAAGRLRAHLRPCLGRDHRGRPCSRPDRSGPGPAAGHGLQLSSASTGTRKLRREGGGGPVKASEIAALVGGTLKGGADPELSGVAPLERAQPTELSFLAHPRYVAYVQRSEAGALLVSEELEARVGEGRTRIVVRDVHRALALVLNRLYPERPFEAGVHPTAIVHEEAVLGTAVAVGPYAVIGRGARIGDRARIGAHVVIGEDCE